MPSFYIQTVVCGSKVCKDGYTCLETARGKETCLQTYLQCHEESYLVTGPYGVESDKVTFSSVWDPSNSALMSYMLDSAGSWTPASSDTNQWIQVMFQSRKVVKGVVIQGNGAAYTYRVTSYQVRSVVCDAWGYVKDSSGSIVTFPGNTDRTTKITNYLSEPIMTSGVRLIPQTWVGFIKMRFDLLGCPIIPQT